MRERNINIEVKREKMVVFTSFRKSQNFNGEKFSIARFQPKGYRYKELRFLAAEDEKGGKILLRNFENPIEDYREVLRRSFKARGTAIRGWLESLSPDVDIVLCCWCPYSKSTQEQIKKRGSFVCHSGLIAQMIRKYRPDVPVELDDDRQKYLIDEWRVGGGEFHFISKEGLPLIYNEKVSDYVVVVKDRDEAIEAMSKLNAVIYTENEVSMLRGKRDEVVRLVHAAKKILTPAWLVDIVPLKKS